MTGLTNHFTPSEDIYRPGGSGCQRCVSSLISYYSATVPEVWRRPGTSQPGFTVLTYRKGDVEPELQETLRKLNVC